MTLRVSAKAALAKAQKAALRPGVAGFCETDAQISLNAPSLMISIKTNCSKVIYHSITLSILYDNPKTLPLP